MTWRSYLPRNLGQTRINRLAFLSAIHRPTHRAVSVSLVQSGNSAIAVAGMPLAAKAARINAAGAGHAPSRTGADGVGASNKICRTVPSRKSCTAASRHILTAERARQKHDNVRLLERLIDNQKSRDARSTGPSAR